MVHIARIVVRNFKSFSDNVKLNFQQGFNVITGPNGSGKSNIIDAVQFVFGELGSKRMRVPDLSGLIFDGAEEDSLNNPQFAQVTIYFDNSNRGLAVDRKTVSVGRRIDRQGNSKYFLNGKRVSRRQLLDFLVMAGISPGGYNIVLQGTATRLSDLTPSERMVALEDLVGITEYDEKKAEAKVRLAEAERKIEVASAKSDEVRKRVNELERQRNDALSHRLLTSEEQRLGAFKLSYQIAQLETKIGEIRGQISENQAEIDKLEVEKTGLVAERDAAEERLEGFTKEASQKGNTQLPLLTSELIGKRALRDSLQARLREIESRKISLQNNIENKLKEIEHSEIEKDEKRERLRELSQSEAQLSSDMVEKEAHLKDLAEKISATKETAEFNQARVEKLTEDLVPWQESMSGIEIEINKHLVNSNAFEAKINELVQKKDDSTNTKNSLASKINDYEALKVDEAKKLEGMLTNIEEQVKRQKDLRSTIEGANSLAKNAELTITEFTAKRDLWESVVTEEKAQARIMEMGEAGALKGYHGPLRSLVKIDLKYQRATRMAAEGWVDAILVDDIKTALDCVERLKQNKLGMTRFIPLKDINPPAPLEEVEGPNIEGYIPNLIRYDETYARAINLIWGDTFIVKDRDTAVQLAQKGYRTVTLSGDVFEADGGVIGGHYRRPPDYSKLIPSEESVTELSRTIKTLRESLSKRMSDLKLSGGSLREFTGYMDSFNGTIERIEGQIKETNQSIQRLERNIASLDENIRKVSEERDGELGLVETLRERKNNTLQEIERVKAEIAALRGLSKPSDVAGLEVTCDTIDREIVEMRSRRAQLLSEISVQTNLIDKYLDLKTSDSESQVEDWRKTIESLDLEYKECQSRLEDEASSLAELQKVLDGVTSEVEATSKILEQHRKAVRNIEQQIERLESRRSGTEKRSMTFKVEEEKYRLQIEQKFEELARLGFGDVIPIEDVDLNYVERTLQRIRTEKASIGAINQLAIQHYEEVVVSYKQLSVRINELEEEKGSILKFIDEVEKEKTEHFMKAFNQVGENFSNVFAKLTSGGDGRLELQRPEDPFSGGVDLYVQFPSKPMRLVSGTSGGERSVAAICYLLAIQRFLKSPFYLFDEIDAHLDDINTARLADVLKENALESQFIIVSLKDVIIHNADKIYGVFSQGGRSRVISLPMKVEVAV